MIDEKSNILGAKTVKLASSAVQLNRLFFAEIFDHFVPYAVYCKQ
jgi:hypothetical protein